MNKAPACCRSAAVAAFVFASTMSATLAQETTGAENVPQQLVSRSEQQEKGVRAFVTVMPGFMERIELQTEVKTIVIGDDSLVNVRPITAKSVLVEGKKIGRTNVIILDPNDRESTILDVKVDPLPGSKTVEVFDSKDVHNSVSYECISKLGCGYPTVHEVKPEDLPKGYSHVTQRTE